jgi:N-acetylmuramoyl-L-alanine amidase
MTPSRIILHHSGTSDGEEMSWNAIRKYHIEHNQWADIGYNAGVELVGASYEVLMGRPWDRSGAHCIGQNNVSLGICLVGNFNLAAPPEAQLRCAARHVAMWCRMFEIPVTEIYRHSSFNDTDCPGDYFDLDQFKSMVLDA